jgi:hypothetical protein
MENNGLAESGNAQGANAIRLVQNNEQFTKLERICNYEQKIDDIIFSRKL